MKCVTATEHPVIARPPPNRRPRRRVLWALGAMAVLASAGTAFAANIDVSSEDVTVNMVTANSGAPTVYAWDDFERTVNPLQGSNSPSANLWKPEVGSWLTNGTTAQASSSNADANTLIDAPGVDASLVVTITPVGGNPTPGVTFNDDGTDNMLLLYTKAAGGTLTLYTYFGPTRVFLAGATGIGPRATPFELRVTSVGPVITVFVNGTQVMTETLAGANLCKFKDIGCAPNGGPNVGFGLWADTDTVSTFNDFRIESA